MTAYNNDILLSVAARNFSLEPCEPPEQAQTWAEEPLKEGDIVEKFTFDGPAWFRLVAGRKYTGRATPNYNPQSELGHRD
jgi:hypothetical protein